MFVCCPRFVPDVECGEGESQRREDEANVKTAIQSSSVLSSARTTDKLLTAEAKAAY